MISTPHPARAVWAAGPRGFGAVGRTATLCALLLGALLAFRPAPAGAKEYVVRIVSDYENLQMSFDPATLRIEPGDRVVWVNMANEEHNVVTYPDGFPEGAQGFASPYLRQRHEMWSHTFTAEGTYEYHCVPHLLMGMRGTVTVSRPSRVGEFHTPTKEEIGRYRKLMAEFHGDGGFEFVPRSQRGDHLSARHE